MDIFEGLTARDIPPSRIRVIRREGTGGYLYHRGQDEAALLTEIELYEREPLLTDIFLLRPDLKVLIRALPRPVEGLASIRNLRSFGVPLESSARLIGSRIILASHDSPRRILKCFRRGNACIVKASADDREPAYALAGGRSEEDALLTMLALERVSRAFLEGSLIGGARGLLAWAVRGRMQSYMAGEEGHLDHGGPLHRAIYDAFPEVQAVVFSEGDRLAVFAACHTSFSVNREEYLEVLGGAPALVKGSRPRDIVRALRKTSSGCLILAGQGVLVTGRSEEEAQEKLKVLERAAGRYLDDKVRDLRG